MHSLFGKEFGVVPLQGKGGTFAVDSRQNTLERPSIYETRIDVAMVQ